jgi:hypothetical protein
MEIIQNRDTRLVGSAAASRAVWVRHDPARRDPKLVGTEFYGVAVGGFRRNQFVQRLCDVVLHRLNKVDGNKRLVAVWAVIPEGASAWR